MNPGFHLSCDENLSKGWGPPLEVGYHRQARVENAFFRYKSILGDRLRSRTRAAQAVELVLACNVLNRMTELGRPESFAIDR